MADTGFSSEFLKQVETILARYRTRGWRIATAESCTGGLIAGCLTEIAGSSDVVDRGFVTYSNEAKAEMLGVPADMIEAQGAVSEPVARAMAEGALARAAPEAQLSVAVTGVAGPGSDSQSKPAGLVHFAAAQTGKDVIHEMREFGDVGRDVVRRASVAVALDLILRRLAED